MVLVHPSRGSSGQANAKAQPKELEEPVLFLKALSASRTDVAIDDKIELAMDLAKSHVMLAVRKQIDALRNEIRQLLDAKSRLELENGLLRAAVAPEVLAQLRGQHPSATAIAAATELASN